VPEPYVVDLGDFEISTDATRIDIDRIEAFLRDSYWAPDRPRHIIEKSLASSLCFGVYEKAGGRQVGLARVVTDFSSFSWLADVYIEPSLRGGGLGKALIEAVVSHPQLAGVRMALATRDAHSLYAQYGFKPLPEPDNWMLRPGDLQSGL
jgi:GNAT superfamily N-acetyltransferase